MGDGPLENDANDGVMKMMNRMISDDEKACFS